jgi:hypothetical protein
MEMVLAEHTLPEDKQIKLFTHLRLAYAFPSFDQRLLCIQARLQALSILGNQKKKKENLFIKNFFFLKFILPQYKKQIMFYMMV